jgi:hypothetical protein
MPSVNYSRFGGIMKSEEIDKKIKKLEEEIDVLEHVKDEINKLKMIRQVVQIIERDPITIINIINARRL